MNMIQENFIQVDQNKCVRCSLCVNVCRGTLGMGSNGPEIVRQLCIGCGHCVAVCPNGAMNNLNAPLENQVEIERSSLTASGTAARFIRSRRSIRNYQQKAVNRETMIQLLDIARYAPTACNSQGVCYHVVDNPDTLRRITAATVDWAEQEMRKGSTIATSPWAANTEAQIELYRKSGTDVVLRYTQRWNLILKNCGHSMKWKELAVSRMLLVMIKRRMNTFFMIVQRKVLKAAEMFVTTDDTHWPHLFEREAKRIISALGGKALWVEHIGGRANDTLPRLATG